MPVRAYIHENGIRLIRDGARTTQIDTIDNPVGRRYSEHPLGIELPEDLIDCVQKAKGKISVLSIKCPGDKNPVNQDAAVAAVITDSKGQDYHFASTADGLGGSGLPYKVERGARLAVLCALKVMHTYITNPASSDAQKFNNLFEDLTHGISKKTPERIHREILDLIGPAIEYEFLNAVQHDFKHFRDGYVFSNIEGGFKYYASTLNFTIIGSKGGFSFKLGDGGVADFNLDRRTLAVKGLDGCEEATQWLGYTKSTFKEWCEHGKPLTPKYEVIQWAEVFSVNGMQTVLATDGLEKTVRGGAKAVTDAATEHLRTSGATLAPITLHDDTTIIGVTRPSMGLMPVPHLSASPISASLPEVSRVRHGSTPVTPPSTASRVIISPPEGKGADGTKPEEPERPSSRVIFKGPRPK